jgi:hypothetical protein
MPKIFGIGWAKTGTTTLGRCLEILGYDHQGQRLELAHDVAAGDLGRIRALAEAKDSFEDWPWIILYRQLDEMFPGSRFILTQRDPDGWLESYRNMAGDLRSAAAELNTCRRILYSLPFPDVTDQQLVDRYVAHNEEVQEYFSDRPDALLVVNWWRGDGWKELCSFLGRPVPAAPFPHANRGRYSPLARLRRRARTWRSARRAAAPSTSQSSR